MPRPLGIAMNVPTLAGGGGVSYPESITDDFAADSGLWLDGNLAAAAMTVSGGKGVWAPTEGAEIHTSANAASDPNSNEADATTGWGAVDITLTSQGADKSTGSYALNLVTTAASGRAETLADANRWFVYRADAKQITGTKWRLQTSGLYPMRLQTTNDWASYVVTSYRNGAAISFGYLCDVGAIDDVGRLDNVSIKALTPATLFRVQRVYYPSTVSAKLWWPAGIQQGVILFQDADNWVMANLYHYRTINNAALTKSVAGTVTQVANGGVTYSAGATLELIPAADFQTWTVKYADTTEVNAAAITDFAASGTWYAGLFTTYDAGNTAVVGFDDFSATRITDAPPF